MISQDFFSLDYSSFVGVVSMFKRADLLQLADVDTLFIQAALFFAMPQRMAL